MSDVFISYARAAEPQAQQVADALRGLGYGVWRDDDLPAHRGYAQVIEERLEAAKAVVVIWCAAAAKSEWVQSEADRARVAGKLVQLRVDETAIPMPFDRIQCADLSNWRGQPDAHDWRKVVDSVAELMKGSQAAPAPAIAAPLPTLPASRSSVAVIPFTSLSNDPEQAYFAEGIAEEIVSALSRFKSLFVIAASSSMVIRGRAASPQEAAEHLGVRYLLEGSVRRAGGRVRISLHLIDASNGAEMWSDRLEDTFDDVFALQDRVAQRVAGALEAQVLDADRDKAIARPTDNLTSYDLYLRARELFRLSRRDDMVRSIALLDQAIALDPNYAIAHSQSAVCYRQIVDHGWAEELEVARRRGLDRAEKALQLDGGDPMVLAQVAAALPGLEGRLDRARALIERAITLNPDSAFIRLIAGSIYLRCGDPDLATKHLETAMQLDPISSNNAFVRMYLASARFQQQRFDEALALFRTTTMRLPVSYAILASLYGHLGQIAHAEEALAAFRVVSGGDLEHYADLWFPRPEYRKLLLEGVALAEGSTAPAA